MKRFYSLCIVLALLLSIGILPASAESSDTTVVNLKTQGLVNPVGVNELQPEFSWQMLSSATGAKQTSYHIIVKDAQNEVVWDSGVVQSAQSVGVLYNGASLTPASEYSWNVTITDQAGRECTSEEATFETSLLDSTFASWAGAQWIGSGELALDAASKAVFHISADVQLAEGSKTASFVLGADDFRLNNKVFNPWLYEGENWVRVELDFSGATGEGGAKINVYRLGYVPGEDASVPFAVVEDNAELDSVLNSGNMYAPHHVDIFCANSTLTFTVDGAVVNGTPDADCGYTPVV